MLLSIWGNCKVVELLVLYWKIVSTKVNTGYQIWYTKNSIWTARLAGVNFFYISDKRQGKSCIRFLTVHIMKKVSDGVVG